jgi:hypothetical protein
MIEPYTKECTICGNEYIAPRRYSKYCDNCRKIGYKLSEKRRSVKMNNDTEEMRNACLTCPKPKCGGQCERLALIAKKSTAKNEEDE